MLGDAGLVQVAEQYPLMPLHAARLAVVDGGVIGRPSTGADQLGLLHAVALVATIFSRSTASRLT